MKPNSLIFSLCLLLGITSCTSYKKVPYLQTEDKRDVINLRTLSKENTVRFQPDDALGIVVNVVGEQSVAYDYNLPLQPTATTDNSEDIVNQGMGRQTYMIDKEGRIDFPVLGLVKVAGYTQEELEKYLKESLRDYLKVDPIVTVRLLNFKISVIGEVNRPGQYNINKDRINILEALALAGDMTIYGKRDEIEVIREMPNGELKIVTLDISKAQTASSPYFYLHQNDQIYVVPNSIKARSAFIGGETSLIVSVFGLLFTVTSVIISVAKSK
ncbi:MAG: polysaccharide biosynthesis/export family protein [Candidatus Symbiothrix sp.]|jgi:polysaccharide export outer membrane protein|nr:polysaccharide biosynthesis/export family protein [Candidatus Symbiothrix sp.]